MNFKSALLVSVLLLTVACSGSEGTVANCGTLQKTCLDRGMCLVSTNSGTTGGSAGGSYGAGGVSANGSFSDSASCGFTCSECGDGGVKQALSSNGNCNGATINVGPGANVSCNSGTQSGSTAAPSNTSPSPSPSPSSEPTSTPSGSSGSQQPPTTGYNFQWYPCIDITVVPLYSNCTAYCKAHGAICGNQCVRTVWDAPGLYHYGSKDASIQYSCDGNECATKLAGVTPATDNCDGTQLLAGQSNSTYANVCGSNQKWQVAECCCGTQ